MKKYLSHVIYLFIILFLGFFGFVKSQEVQENSLTALEARTEALEYQKRAEAAALSAEAAAARAIEEQIRAEKAIDEAYKQTERAEEALKNCKGK